MERDIKIRMISGAKFGMKDFGVAYDMNSEKDRQAYKAAELRDPQNTSPSVPEATPTIY
ncbi:MAG: hypothetical protein KA155_01565 [Alphaproteobacteria bacterium]|jgi:hypothetical protein|nr:hypothetical protein [Alphaproteobacteria bacterium]